MFFIRYAPLRLWVAVSSSENGTNILQDANLDLGLQRASFIESFGPGDAAHAEITPSFSTTMSFGEAVAVPFR